MLKFIFLILFPLIAHSFEFPNQQTNIDSALGTDSSSVRAQYDPESTSKGQVNSFSNLMLDLAGCANSVLRKYNITNEAGQLYETISSPTFMRTMELGSDQNVKESVISAVDPIFQKISGFDHKLMVQNLPKESLGWIKDSALILRGYRERQAKKAVQKHTKSSNAANITAETSFSGRFEKIIEPKTPAPPVASTDNLAQQRLQQNEAYIQILQKTIDLQDQQVRLLKQNLTAQLISTENESIKYEKQLIQKDKNEKACKQSLKDSGAVVIIQNKENEKKLGEAQENLKKQIENTDSCNRNLTEKQAHLQKSVRNENQCKVDYSQKQVNFKKEMATLKTALDSKTKNNKKLTSEIKQKDLNLKNLKNDQISALQTLNSTCSQNMLQLKTEIQQANQTYERQKFEFQKAYNTSISKLQADIISQRKASLTLNQNHNLTYAKQNIKIQNQLKLIENQTDYIEQLRFNQTQKLNRAEQNALLQQIGSKKEMEKCQSECAEDMSRQRAQCEKAVKENEKLLNRKTKDVGDKAKIHKQGMLREHENLVSSLNNQIKLQKINIEKKCLNEKLVLQNQISTNSQRSESIVKKLKEEHKTRKENIEIENLKNVNKLKNEISKRNQNIEFAKKVQKTAEETCTKNYKALEEKCKNDKTELKSSVKEQMKLRNTEVDTAKRRCQRSMDMESAQTQRAMKTLNNTLHSMQSALQIQSQTVHLLRSNLTSQREHLEQQAVKLQSKLQNQIESSASEFKLKFQKAKEKCDVQIQQNASKANKTMEGMADVKRQQSSLIAEQSQTVYNLTEYIDQQKQEFLANRTRTVQYFSDQFYQYQVQIEQNKAKYANSLNQTVVQMNQTFFEALRNKSESISAKCQVWINDTNGKNESEVYHLFTSACPKSAKCYKTTTGQRYRTYDGKAVLGKTISVFNNLHQQGCFIRCNNDKDCKSANYRTSDGQCELKSTILVDKKPYQSKSPAHIALWKEKKAELTEAQKQKIAKANLEKERVKRQRAAWAFVMKLRREQRSRRNPRPKPTPVIKVEKPKPTLIQQFQQSLKDIFGKFTVFSKDIEINNKTTTGRINRGRYYGPKRTYHSGDYIYYKANYKPTYAYTAPNTYSKIYKKPTTSTYYTGTSSYTSNSVGGDSGSCARCKQASKSDCKVQCGTR